MRICAYFYSVKQYESDTILMLGGNLGDVKSNFEVALSKLGNEKGSIYKQSSLYQSDPWGDTDQPLLPLGHITQPVTEYLLVFGAHRFWLAAGETRRWFDLVDRVITDRIIFRRGKALAFHGHYMQELRAFQVAGIAQR